MKTFKLLPLLVVMAAITSGCGRDTAIDLPYYLSSELTPEWIENGTDRGLHEVADFSFKNQDGSTVSKADLSGRVYVASFFFVRCSAICPTLRSNLTRVQAAYRDDDGVRLLSHTVDPEADTAEILRGYAAVNGVVSGKWDLVTGTQESIYSHAVASYFADLDDLDEGFLHTENFYLVDGSGHIRGIYNGTLELDVQRLIEDIGVLRAGV